MTLVKVTYEGTNGTALSTANTGLTTLVSGGGASATFDSTAAFDGATGATYISDGTNASYGQKNFNAPATTGAVSIAFTIPATPPAADYGFATVYDTANARVFGLLYRSNGEVAVSDKASTYIRILTAAQATAGTKFRFELTVSALSTTAGTYTARAYNTSDVQVGTAATPTTANTGTTAMSYLRHGATTAAAFTAKVDSVQLNDGSTTEIGRLVSSGPPVVNGVVTANMAVLDASGSTGTAPLTYSISPTTNVSTISTGKYAVPSGVTYTVSVTDGNQQTSTNQYVIAAGSSGVVVRTQVRVAGVWTTPVGS